MRLADYLFTRLKQLGIGSIHGVPGDYNLKLLDYVEPNGIHWVGNANELNAGYAADGYARIKGIGALITTFGVGELSAINAIAGAYTERAAVVHIVGTPERASQEGRLKIHHTFNDGDYRRFGQMHAHVTVAQTRLEDPRTAVEQIDEVLRQCILHSRPVYIEIPVDLVTAQVSGDRLETKIVLTEPTARPSQDKAIEAVLERIMAAKQPVILVDGEVRAMHVVTEVQDIVQELKWPTWTSTYAKSLIDEGPDHFHGIFRGTFGDPKTREFIEGSDLVLCIGPHYSSTNSYAYTAIPKADITISVSDTTVQVGSKDTFRDVPAKPFLTQLLAKLSNIEQSHSYATSYPDLLRDTLLNFSEQRSSDPITQDKVWRLLANFFEPGDIILGETGTAGYGILDVPLPHSTHLFTPVTWLSIGYMLPAAQGAALAQRELAALSSNSCSRTILLIGDGSFQMTAQELGTIIREKLNVIVFLINNDGYTIERCIHGLKQKYNDVPSWKYLEAPSMMGADSKETFTARVRTWGELENVLKEGQMVDGEGLRMIEVMMEREDAPAGVLTSLMEKQKKAVAEEGE